MKRLSVLVLLLTFAGVVAVTAQAPAVPQNKGRCPSGPYESTDMDLQWSSVDANALPLNARWQYQIANPGCHPDPFNFCSWPKDDSQPLSCSTQGPEINGRQLPVGRHGLPKCTLFSRMNTFCWACPETSGEGGSVPGVHFNWAPASYQGGSIRFGSYKSDFVHDKDVNLEYQPQEGAGSTQGDEPPGSLHLEFYSRESLVYFRSPWWERFNGMNREGRRQALPGSPSSVTGLLGLDCEHGCKTELHPVFILSARVSESKDGLSEHWAFFVRNWGDEGYCGSKLYFLEGTDRNESDGSSVYAVNIPWKSGMTSVQLAPRTTVMSNHPAVQFVSITCAAQGGVDLLFRLPAASSGYPRVDGDLELHWSKVSLPASRSAISTPDLPKDIEFKDVRRRTFWVSDPTNARGSHEISRKDDIHPVSLPSLSVLEQCAESVQK